MFTLLIVIHVIICISLIIVVLMQSAKGEGLAGALGGAGLTGTVFGGRGAATFLSRATTYLAVAFMLSCLGLTFVSPGSRVGRQESAIQRELGGGLPTAPAEGEGPVGMPEGAGGGEGTTVPAVPPVEGGETGQTGGGQSGEGGN
ncbi:MAG: preprotein translocase subunit SecG [candidate division Zixibacteria bacterium]|nr:preprotein translocase subunit SecG [candidate division Zixibacteria bacterium]